jgi:hypothetical protein
MADLPSNKLLHILMWNYKDDIPEGDRHRLEEELLSLPSKIPALREVRRGPVVGGRNQSFTHCFVMLFDNLQALADYNSHPDHLHFSHPFREACAVQVVIDVQL